MEDFNLVLKNLISKDINQIHQLEVPENLKTEFEKTAETYIKNGNFLHAIKVFILTKNKERLIETGNLCLKNNLIYEAFYSFYHSESKSNLNLIGEKLMQLPDIENSLKAFRKAENQEMVLFIEENLV